MASLPEWMVRSGSAEWSVSTGETAAKHRSNVVRRATGAFARLLSGMLQDDETASSRGYLQGVDPRFKTVALVGLTIVATMLHTFPSLFFAYGICVGLAVVSQVSFRRLAGLWLVVPLFSAAIMLPAVLNVVTPGESIFTICHFYATHIGPWQLPKELAITYPGLLLAGRFILRSAVCVSLVTLLASTTPRPRLFHSLRSLGVPKIFVALLNMMERYLVVLIRSAEEIHLAKISRSIAPRALRQEQAWVAAGMGSLFRRTYRLSNVVYMAMISRGYTGEIRVLDPPKSQLRDWLFVVAAIALAVVLLLIG